MKRLRLWLARLLLPRGWGIVPLEPGKVYRAVEAGGRLFAGDLVALVYKEPHADTLTQEQMDRPTPPPA